MFLPGKGTANSTWVFFCAFVAVLFFFLAGYDLFPKLQKAENSVLTLKDMGFLVS